MTDTTRRNGGEAPARSELWLERDGARLFALELGRGWPFVFLHGGLADHRSGLVRLEPLARSCRLILPDLRGSGRSRFAGELSWDLLADDVCGWLDHLGIDRAVVGGVSMGTAVALRFGLRYPGRTRGLVLWSPLYAGQDRGLMPAQRSAMATMAAAGREALERGIDALGPLYERLPTPMRERALAMMQGFDPASVAATTRFLASDAQPFASARELRAIEAPVLLIPGADAEHPPEVSELYAKHLRHCSRLTSNTDLARCASELESLHLGRL